jgi:hypothetical protein
MSNSRQFWPMAVKLVVLLFASTPFVSFADQQRSSPGPKCEDVESIGVATMAVDGAVTLRIRSLPPGPIAEGVFVYKPSDLDYQVMIDHVGGLSPGQSKPVKPWC